MRPGQKVSFVVKWRKSRLFNFVGAELVVFAANLVVRCVGGHFVKEAFFIRLVLHVLFSVGRFDSLGRGFTFVVGKQNRVCLGSKSNKLDGSDAVALVLEFTNDLAVDLAE